MTPPSGPSTGGTQSPGATRDAVPRPAGESRRPEPTGTSADAAARAGGAPRTPLSPGASTTDTPRPAGDSRRPAPSGSAGSAAPAPRGPAPRSGARAPRPFRLWHDSKPSADASVATTTPSAAPGAGDAPEPPGFPGTRTAPVSPPPPPPPPSARFPDAPPSGPRTAEPEDGTTETTGRLRPVPAEPPTEPPGTGRPFVSFAEPEIYESYDAYRSYDGDTARPRPVGARTRHRAVTAAASAVLGLGLIGGAVTGSWLTGNDPDADSARTAFVAAGSLWHSVPVDQLFPPTVQGQGAGPGGADRTWTRIAVAPDSGCANAFDPLLRKVLAPVGCLRLLRATYTDATHSQVTTVGLLFTNADAAVMTSLKARFQRDGLDRRSDLMPRAYAAKDTVAAGFGDAQRASWTVSVLTDAPVVVFAVSGFADGRVVTAPQPAEDAIKPGSTTTPAQAGLGNDAQGLADRVERSLRKTVGSATEKPS